jgi:hypothetical protein
LRFLSAILKFNFHPISSIGSVTLLTTLQKVGNTRKLQLPMLIIVKPTHSGVQILDLTLVLYLQLIIILVRTDIPIDGRSDDYVVIL